eukprot:scaffold747_cov308-Prasinococcus_capsulatus_cf.AAC.3
MGSQWADDVEFKVNIPAGSVVVPDLKAAKEARRERERERSAPQRNEKLRAERINEEQLFRYFQQDAKVWPSTVSSLSVPGSEGAVWHFRHLFWTCASTSSSRGGTCGPRSTQSLRMKEGLLTKARGACGAKIAGGAGRWFATATPSNR